MTGVDGDRARVPQLVADPILGAPRVERRGLPLLQPRPGPSQLLDRLVLPAVLLRPLLSQPRQLPAELIVGRRAPGFPPESHTAAGVQSRCQIRNAAKRRV